MSPTFSTIGVGAAGEFLQLDAAFHLHADVDDGDVLFDGDDAAFDDTAFVLVVLLEALVEKGGEIIARGVHFAVHIGRHAVRLTGVEG